MTVMRKGYGAGRDVIPLVTIPRVWRSRRQYVTWTKRARDIMIRWHGFRAEDFIRIGTTEPSMYGGPRYPLAWQTHYFHITWLIDPPRGAIVYWPEGVDISSEAYDPRDPVELLREIQYWAVFIDGGSEITDAEISAAWDVFTEGDPTDAP